MKADTPMQALEDMEARAPCVKTLEGDLPMITCEDALDISFLSGQAAPIISEALASTRVGEVRERFLQQLSRCMLAELCEDDPVEADLGESIFEPASRMGLQPEESEDHWIRDETTATWTRVIIVPR